MIKLIIQYMPEKSLNQAFKKSEFFGTGKSNWLGNAHHGGIAPEKSLVDF